MKYLLKLIIKKIFNKHFKIWQNLNISFSQDGEDLVLEKLFDGVKKGFYIDVGAHHPFRFSNTYKFYTKGWRGINIDASPVLLNDFNKFRKEDINLNYLVSDNDKIMNFYIFNEQALNTVEKSVADQVVQNNTQYKLVDTIPIKSKPLRTILQEYLPDTQMQLDFMSIDCEGHDLEVLKSNNWDKYKPKVIVVEIKEPMESLFSNEIYIYLNSLGYSIKTKQMFSSIFVLN